MRFSLPRGAIMEISNLVPSNSASVEGVFVETVSPIKTSRNNKSITLPSPSQPFFFLFSTFNSARHTSKSFRASNVNFWERDACTTVE